MAQKYNNRVELKDGEIVLFHRDGAKRPIWHMRIHVRGMRDLSGKKFSHIQETTGELDLDEAKRVALERYDDLRLRVRNQQPAKSVSFSDVYALWWTKREAELHATWTAKGRTGVNARIAWYEKQSARYWIPYFGQHKFDEMTQALVEGYWQWRMTYWSKATEAERMRYANHALTPSKKTLDMEQSALKEVFAWGSALQLFNFRPIISNPYSRKGIAAKRRPSFDAHELKVLHAYIDRWVLGEGDKDKEAGARINSRHLYQRKLLRLFLQWIEGTGMRTGEVLLLKHSDVKRDHTDLYEALVLKITVSDQTKTGARTVVSNPSVVGVYAELCALTGHLAATDWLFCDQKGKQCKGFFKTLPEMLAEAGVLTDKNGYRRSAYSFRHVYAENRFAAIGFNPIAFDLIGTNMGTGRESLEKHYVRRGIIGDADALIANHGLVNFSGPEGEAERAAKLEEIARRERRGY
jgi:integrase